MTETMSNQEFEQLLLNSYTYKINVADVVKGVVVKKEKRTPEKYPRGQGKPLKQPL